MVTNVARSRTKFSDELRVLPHHSGIRFSSVKNPSHEILSQGRPGTSASRVTARNCYGQFGSKIF